MGMSSSQARLLSLTSRLHNIEYKAQKIEADKLRLANDSNKVYNDYQNALNATKIQYSALNNDGSITFVDATLNSLENGVVADYKGATSKNTYLLYDGQNNKVLITPEFAKKYGITGDTVDTLGSLDDYLLAHGCKKETVTNPDTYTISGSLSTPVDNSIAGSTSYSISGATPTVASTPYSTSHIDDKDLLVASTTYSVSTADDLVKLSRLINNGATSNINVILTNDIDMTGVSGWNSISKFVGSFNGNGKTIKGLTSALFNNISGATVTNLSLDSGNVSGRGTLANTSSNANISNIKASGNVTSSAEGTGGLIGADTGSTIKNCSFTGSVNSTERGAGGFIGNASGTKISSCKAEASVTGLRRVGGFCGFAENSTSIDNSISNSNVTATVSDNDTGVDSGGFIGSSINTRISYSEAHGTLHTNNNWSIGGFSGAVAGSDNARLIIDNCTTDVSVTYDREHPNPDRRLSGTFSGDARGVQISNSNSLASMNGNSSASFIGRGTTNTTVSNSYTPASSITTNAGTLGATDRTGSQISSAKASYTAPSLTSTTVPSSAVPVASLTNDKVVQGTLTISGENSELESYLAYNLYQDDNSKTYEEYLTSIQSKGYDAYQLAELVENLPTYKTKLATGSDLKTELKAYSDATHTLVQTASNFTVKNTSTTEEKKVTVANPDDILDRLAYDIQGVRGTGNVNDIKTQLRAIFSNEQLASLSYNYGKGEWNTIVNSLSTSMSVASVSGYTDKYTGYNITYKSTNDVVVSTITGSSYERWVEDDNYKTWYKKYMELQAMQGYQFKIVDAAYCNDNSFVNNYITQAGASLLTFSTNSDGSFNMVGTNVSVETSLQEVSDTVDLKKAEAKYEADMRAINIKDSKYDTQLASCETERNAIKEEVETLKNVAKDNVDRTFKLFS